MLRFASIFLLLATTLAAASIRLYLTDGTHHRVREYEVKSDRVRFYSLERSQWEEIPLDLVDLIKTGEQAEAQAEWDQEEEEFWDEEEEVVRQRRREVARVPQDIGAYLVDGEKMRPLPHADLEVKSNKKKEVLSVISPIPIIAGKQKVRIKGPHSAFVVTTPKPEFYIRLIHEERFGIIRLKPDGEWRDVEKWTIAPVTNEVFEEHEDISVFRREMDDGLYKVWPKAPLEPGEYAVVEFSLGEANIQVWDFSYRPSGGSPAPKTK
jgi:hypothetical protein